MDHTDWQLNKGILGCNQYLLENGLNSDAELNMGEDGEVIKVHKFILSARSPVFERMFGGGFVETREPVIITDIDVETMQAVLKYCYYDCREIPNRIALPTLYAAKKYMLTFLEQLCRDILIKNLRGGNLWEVYTYGKTWGDNKLTEGCRKFLRENVKNVSTALKARAFTEIPHHVLLDMLKINTTKTKATGGAQDKQAFGVGEIMISDIELFYACDKWAKAECKRQSLEPTGPNKRKVLSDCLFQLRFPSMEPSDVVNLVFSKEILTEEEKNQLCMRLLQNSTSRSSTPQVFPSKQQHMLMWLDTKQSDQPFVGKSGVGIETKVKLQLTGLWVRIKPDLPFSDREITYVVQEKLFNKTTFSARSYLKDLAIPALAGSIGFVKVEPVTLKAHSPYYIWVDKSWNHRTNENYLNYYPVANVVIPKQLEVIVTDHPAGNNGIAGLLVSFL